MMWNGLRHDNEFMYEMVICCNVKWPACHVMMAGATRLPLSCKRCRDSLQVTGDDGKCTWRTPA